MVCGAGGGPTLFKVQNLDLLEPHLNLDLLAFKRLSKKLGWSMRLDLRTEFDEFAEFEDICSNLSFFLNKGMMAFSRSWYSFRLVTKIKKKKIENSKIQFHGFSPLFLKYFGRYDRS